MQRLRLIVGEVVMEWEPKFPFDPAPVVEGATWYPDGKVWVRTLANTPPWISRRNAGGSRRRVAAS